MSRQGQFVTVPCRCLRTQGNQSPNSRHERNENADVDEYNFENAAPSRKGCPEMNEELWNALSSLREKTCRYKSNMGGNDFDNVSPRYGETRSPPYGGANVLKKANDLIDYVPESEFLRKMKQQCRFLQCNEPNIFSALDEVTDDRCFDFERPRPTEQKYRMDETYFKNNYSPQPLPVANDPPLSYNPKGNENYSTDPNRNFPCSCQHCQGLLAEDKKSEHVSRNKKRVKGGRRKRKSGSAGTYDSEDQFLPSLKKPYENSCPRCWRFASPARSPVNKPDQKFDPNFRRAHSCATLEGKMEEDFDNLQAHDQKNSPCYRSKSIPSGPINEKPTNRISNVKSGHSPPRAPNDAVRFSQPPSASPRAPDLQISAAKNVQDFNYAQPPSPPRGMTNYMPEPPPKSTRDPSPGRYSAPSQPMHDPSQYYSAPKSRPDFSPPRAPQEYSHAQTRPKSMHECPQHSSPSRPRPGSSPSVPRYSSPPRSNAPDSPGTIMLEYLPPRCPVHPDVLLHPPAVRQMQSPKQPPLGEQIPEPYATPSVRPPQETTYVLKASPRRTSHLTCPKHGPKMTQLEPMPRPKPQSFIPGPSFTEMNRCYVNVDQQNAASRGMYAPVEKDQCFQICNNMEFAEEDDLNVTEYKTFTPKSQSGKDQNYADYSQSRAGMMIPVPEECSYSARRSRDGSSGPEAQDSPSYDVIKGSDSKGTSKKNSRSSKGSVEFSNAKNSSKSPKNLNKSSSNPSSSPSPSPSPSRNANQNSNSNPSSSPSRRKSPTGSQKKGKKKSSKNGCSKNACGKYTKKWPSPKPSAGNRICPPVQSSPKENPNPCSRCETKAESPKRQAGSAKQKSPTPSPSKQNKPCPSSSPKPGPSGVQKSPQGRPQSANPPTQSSSASPRDRPQTAGSSNQQDSSKSKMATKIPNEFYDAGHRVIDCACFPRVPCAAAEDELMCCHCQWHKSDLNSANNAQDILDNGTQSPKGVRNTTPSTGFQGYKASCPYVKFAHHKLESNLSNISNTSAVAAIPNQNRSSIEESPDLSHSRLLREVKECGQSKKPDDPAARKYVVFYMTQSKEPKGDNIEVLVEELSKSCPDKTDERTKDITEKMKKILDNPTDSMALRFQKGVTQSKTPRSSRILYF